MNLLQSATVARSDPPGFSAGQLQALTDGNAGTTASIPAPAGSAVELVFGFAGEMVAAEQLVVQLPRDATRQTAPAQVEIMVSALSPYAAFQSLRKEPLQAASRAQVFRFRPVAARWILIRLTASASADNIALAELKVLGRHGPPATQYAFKESPAEALEVLKSLQQSVSISLTADEAALFARVRDGRLDDDAFAQAVLLASGLGRARQRPYLKRLDELAGKARQAVGDAGTAFDKGERLLRWLHDEVLTEGYQAQQTSVSTVLDQGTYNCVSSATLHNLLARRLGLDVRAIEVPDHALSIVYDGTRYADVETTTPEGFNPARNPRVLRELEEQRGLRHIPDRHPDQRREIREAGLAAIIYYNRAVDLTKRQRYPEALALYFRALSLDPEFASAIKNVMAVLVNWGNELASAGRFERALEVFRVGLDLAPEDANLRHNQKATWSQWAESLVQAGNSDRALEVLRQAHAALDDDGFLTMQAWVFIQPAEAQVRAGRWEESLATATPGLERLEGPPRDELTAWRTGLFLRWSNAELKQGRFGQATEVLARGLEMAPGDGRLVNNLAYVAQEWVRAAYEEDGRARSADLLRQLIAEYPVAQQCLQRVAEQFVWRMAAELRDSGGYDEALEAVSDCSDLLATEEAAARVQRSIYHAWATTHVDARQWDKAIGVYGRALEQLPEDRHLRNNLRYVAARSLESLREQEGPAAAEARIAEWLKQADEFPELATAIQEYFEQTIAELIRSERYDQALQTVERGAERIGPEHVVRAARIACDQWARQLSQQERWSEAVAVYRRGLERFPGDSHLRNNTIATWNSWASTYIDAKDWDAAIEIYEQALKESPGNQTLMNNLRYCRQEKERTRTAS